MAATDVSIDGQCKHTIEMSGRAHSVPRKIIWFLMNNAAASMEHRDANNNNFYHNNIEKDERERKKVFMQMAE